jgi:hypothetical protein
MAKATKAPAEDRRNADQNAYAEIANQVEAAVESHVSLETFEVLGKRVNTLLQRNSSGTQVKSSLTVSGLTVVDRFYDKKSKIHYALAVLDRVEASKLDRAELARIHTDYKECLDAAQKAADRNDLTGQLASLRASYDAACKYGKMAREVDILVGPADSLLPDAIDEEPSSAAILAKVSALLGALRLEVVDGSDQSFVGGHPLRHAISARVLIGQANPPPASGVLVDFTFTSGSGYIIPTTVKTDLKGLATAQVDEVDDSNGEACVISATVGFRQFSHRGPFAAALNARLPLVPLSTRFTLLPAKGDPASDVFIIVEDSTAGNMKVDALRNVARSQLTENGYKPRDNPKTLRLGDTSGDAFWDGLRKQLPDSADLIIIIKLVAMDMEKPMDMHLCRLRCLGKALDTSTGHVVAFHTANDIRGFGLTQEQAVATACSKAATEIMKPLIQDLLLAAQETGVQ